MLDEKVIKEQLLDAMRVVVLQIATDKLDEHHFPLLKMGDIVQYLRKMGYTEDAPMDGDGVGAPWYLVMTKEGRKDIEIEAAGYMGGVNVKVVIKYTEEDEDEDEEYDD